MQPIPAGILAMDFVIAAKCFNIFKWDFSPKMIVPGSLQFTKTLYRNASV